MGKWNQSRRHGTACPAISTLGPPPAPVLAIVVFNVHQLASGGNDTGGLVILQTSEDGGLSYSDFGSDAWSANYDWGIAGDYSHAWIRCRETGNGTAYIGDSAPSNVLIIP